MKEVRFFYAPDAPAAMELPEEEAVHAVRVLRLEQGDELMLADGRGTFYKAVITETTKKRCLYRITETQPQPRQWKGHLHIAMAPTKNMDRTEWFAEKATEIGFDELTFLCCKFSERKVIKTERIDKILVSAMKQSHKAEKPKLNEMIDFMDFIARDFPGDKYICHCYGEENEVELENKRLLKDVIKKGGDALVLVGPEGDFSVDEVAAAEKAGFVPVSLGESRLRTETAALVAVHIMNLFN
ncbi:MAG: 16S rRNA (uracil(1498)-N(3))-methyltransferase [Prevotellaceae bacterium]|nr:16S rRNA (uracil(1498)-N(3))-methyltransferase [Prevotellaceae bacterium]